MTSPLGSRAAMRVGSSPFRRTSSEIPCLAQIPALRRGFLAGQGISSLPNRIRCAGFRFGLGTDWDSVHRKCSRFPAQKFPPPFRFRLRRKLHSGGNFFAFRRDSLRWTRGGGRRGMRGFDTEKSILTAYCTSEQAAYRLLRLFSKVRVHSLRCAFSPAALRWIPVRVLYKAGS